jgi:hypothetical protein
VSGTPSSPSVPTTRRATARPVHDPRLVAALIAVVGLVLTGAAVWATARADANSEQRLLDRQTQQTAAVLSTAALLVEEPLSTALTVQSVAADDRSAFERFMAAYVGADGSFVSASLWQRTGGQVSMVASSGAPPALTGEAARAYVASAFGGSTPLTRQVDVAGQDRIAWALADPRTGAAVYAERSVPADRRSRSDQNAAFDNLHYAIYFGVDPSDATLTTTDVDPATLPLTGTTARAAVPFGDHVLTLVMTPRDHLGSGLSRWLPVGLLVGGLLLTAISALIGWRLARGRRDAEEDAATITTLYEQVDSLYGQQRELFERLQRALLPPVTPKIADLEVASRYVAGGHGVDIGGDWYSVVALDEHRFAFVVGDVSGRGVDAVAVMAQARFTLRAYLLDGQEPALALEKCSHQFDITADGHLTTVIAGVGDVRTGEVVVANAGHPVPLLLDGDIHPVQVPPGRPLGTGPARYRQVTFHLPPGATLFCFTDGLVERRGEDIDAGLGRLAATLADAAGRDVDDLVEHTVTTLRNPDAADDVAALAIRRVVAA